MSKNKKKIIIFLTKLSIYLQLARKQDITEDTEDITANGLKKSATASIKYHFQRLLKIGLYRWKTLEL